MKVWTLSTAYNEAWIIRESIERYYDTKHPDVETVHIMTDAHWPIDYPNWRKEIERLCAKFGILLFDPGSNLGLHGNFNFAWNKLAIPDNAMVIGYDPDSWPDTKHWDKAMGDIFNERPKVGWLSLWHPHSSREIDEEGKKIRDEVIAGHRVAVLQRPCMNSVCGFRQGWLRKIGGLFEQNHYYGGLECDMWAKLTDNQMEWVFLRDFTESLPFVDRQNMLYRDWKWNYAHLKTTKDDFGTWLKKKGLC